MSDFSITKAYQELAGQLSQTDADPAALTDGALELARQIQSTLYEQWKASITAVPLADDDGTNEEPDSDDLAQRLEYIIDWMHFHNRAVIRGAQVGLPSAMAVQDHSIKVVREGFTPEAIAAMEEAMKHFEGLHFTGGVVQRPPRQA